MKKQIKKLRKRLRKVHVRLVAVFVVCGNYLVRVWSKGDRKYKLVCIGDTTMPNCFPVPDEDGKNPRLG